jgi:hypothetical protein
MAEEEGPQVTVWPIADPDFILKALGSLKGDALPNGKAFFKSYTKWNSLTDPQRNKAMAYFNSLSEPVRFAVKTQVNNLIVAAGNETNQQAAITSANDRARFMHAMVDPYNAVALTAANAPLERTLLDSPDDRMAPWETIAGNFNNYEDYPYQNATIQHADGVPLNPYAANIGMESVAVFTHTINPQDDNRPKRDGAWCEKIWKEIRGSASRINENYRKSGNQDCENQYTEWISFCDNYSDVYKYFKCVVDDGFLDNLGRALPANQQRDTGALGDNIDGRGRALADTPGAVNRRRQRARRTDMTGTTGASPAGTVVDNMAIVVGTAMKEQRKQTILQFFASYEGDDPTLLARRDRAFRSMEEEAFGDGNEE